MSDMDYPVYMKRPISTRIKRIAEVCHEANRAWSKVNGNDSHKPWDETEHSIQESAVQGVIFRLDNPDTYPEEVHNAWMKHKIDEGWVHGSVKDVEAKTHPCILPYEELPEVDRMKDIIFTAIVDALNVGS